MKMRGSRFALLVPGAVTALLLPVMVLGLPSGSASAAITNGCNFGQFPNAPGGQSALTVNCTLTNAGTSSNETIEDFPQAVWHDGAAWTVTGGATTVGSPTVTSTSALAHFNAATDINHTISGGGIPADSFIIAVNSASSVTLNHNATLTKSAETLTIENSSIRAVADGVTHSASKTITSATAHFVSADVGRIVNGTNLPRYDAIASVTNVTTAVLTANATATGIAQTLGIGETETVSTTRQVTDAQLTASSTALSSASATFQASDVQLPVTGCGIPTGTYISSVTDPADVVLSQAATLTRPIAVVDGVTTSASATVTSATASFLSTCDTNKVISGSGIPVGDTIKAVVNATTITLAAKATLTATGVSLTESPGATETIGAPTPTAPLNGDAVSTLKSELTLNPTLVKGAAPCSAGQPTGDTIEGAWYNPGSYGATILSPALPTDTIGQVLYPTAVVSFAAYVVNEGASTPGEQDTAAHTDIIYPFVPTGIALCASPALGIGSVFTFNGTTLTEQKVATGIGRPSTGAVRGIGDLGNGVSTTTGTAYVTNGIPATYSGTCTTNFPATIDFSCGY
jgi:hypothetical protein